jgi:hypothetical protein
VSHEVARIGLSRFIKKRAGETPMEMRYDQVLPPDVAGGQRTSNELVKLIRKLRWMGLEEEALKAQDELNRQGPTTDSVVAASHETD